jgi:kinesin family member 6/9
MTPKVLTFTESENLRFFEQIEAHSSTPDYRGGCSVHSGATKLVSWSRPTTWIMSKSQAEANIQTFLRIRPSKNPSGFFEEVNGESIKFSLPENIDTSNYINNSKLKHAFHFNSTISMSASQEEVFKKVGAPAVQNALDGFNSTIFAYGQTGSGKTFTLTGGPERYQDRGIIPRSISMIYNEIRTRTDVQIKCYVSYLEIYNEQGYDLLDEGHETTKLEDLPKVQMLEDEHGNFHLKNLSMHAADNEEDALNLLFMGDTNRAIAETPMNMASSRSHCIFSVALESRVVGSDTIRRSKLHLVDLAGSERVGKTNSSGSVLTEAKYINTSLFYLEMVIVALYEKATKGRVHVPYRNSAMTSVLRDSLGGNCKTVMIATINPEASNTEESLSTCKFAQRVSLIKNRATINEESDPMQMIKRQKNELLALREEIAYLKGEAGEGDALTPMVLEELKNGVVTYCSNPDPTSALNIGTLTLTKLREAFKVFKLLVVEAKKSSGGGGGGDGGGSREMSKAEVDQVAGKQIADLKSCLLQRDNEIAILVNMVKKGKTAEDVGTASRGTSRPKPQSQQLGASMDSGATSAVSDSTLLSASQMTSVFGEKSGKQRDASDLNSSMNTSIETTSSMSIAAGGGAEAARKRQKSQLEVMQEREQKREAQKQQLILDRHLFGVPPPNDRAIFDDAAKSFEWFQERCTMKTAVEENREILRDKIAEAKTLGERANQSRNTITYLKSSIEAIRREKALQTTMDRGEGKDGDNATTGQSAAEYVFCSMFFLFLDVSTCLSYPSIAPCLHALTRHDV